MNSGARTLAWNLGLLTFLVAALAVILAVSFADPDLWGHILCGLDVLRDGELPERDPYSYATEGQRWIDHEWLGEALLAAAWSAAGVSGLIALKTLAGLATVGVLYWRLARLGLPLVRATIFVFLLCMPVIVAYFGQLRPQFFTLLCLALLLLILDRAGRGRLALLWWTVPLFALWVNLHGGVLAGLGLYALWVLQQLATRWHERWRIGGPALVAASATLLNPWGHGLLIFLLQTATVPRPEVTDWQPLPLLSPWGLFYAVTLGTTVAGLVYTREPRRLAPLLLLALLAVLPWLAVRHLPLFCIGALMLAGDHVASAWQSRIADAGRDTPPPAAAGLIALPYLAAAVVLALGLREGVFSRIRVPEQMLPFAAIELLDASGASGKLSIEFGWGEYAMWTLYPRIRVGMDGRRETIYSRRAYEEYLAFRSGKGDWEAALRNHRVEMALVRTDGAARNLLQLHPDWERVYEDELAALFARRDTEQLDMLRRAAQSFVPSPPKREFP
jgi:hypothetical protein